MNIINFTKIKPHIEFWEKVCSDNGLFPTTVSISNTDNSIPLLLNGKNHGILIDRQKLYNIDEIMTYRGVCFELDKSTIIHININRFETPKSIDWVFCHEYHHMLMFNDKIMSCILETWDNRFNKLVKNVSLKKKEELKDSFSPFEIIASFFATKTIGKDYGDEWYLNRINKKEK